MRRKKPIPVNDLALNIEARGYRQMLLLYPKFWQKFRPDKARLNWKGRPFKSASTKFIPNQPGVYAFVIQPGIPAGLPISVLMYIGKSDRPLRQRFGEYLREMSDPSGRPAIMTLLQMYEGYLHFYCACVSRPHRPDVIEDHLIETLAPPINRQYPATISRVIGAFS